MKQLHIIEPTLNNTAGHCFTVVHSLAMAAREALPDHQVHTWVGHRFECARMADSGAEAHPYFHRRIRRPQLWWLLLRLCKRGDTVLLPTAGRSELALYAMIPEGLRQRGTVWFYLHQLRMDGARATRLTMLAERIPDARILCTHPALKKVVSEAGFRSVEVQPCPFEPPQHIFSQQPFKRIIFPGEARLDKNLPFIVALVRHLHLEKMDIPVMVQAGPNHHGLFPRPIAQLLQELAQIGYAHLEMPRKALAGDAYLNQFSGGICLQPYRVEDYASKISGITLDALTRGCPCIAQQGIWPAEVLSEFSAGLVCAQLNITSWIDSIQAIITDYATYQQRCQLAMSTLSERHHPLRTLETIIGADEDR